MASGAVHAFLASRFEWSPPHSTVVRIGAFAAWFAVVVFGIAAAYTGDGSLLFEAVGSLLAAILMTTQIITGNEDAGLALFGSGLLVAIWHTVFGGSGTVVPAAVALVLISAVGSLFVTRHRTSVAVAVATALFVLPMAWTLSTMAQLLLGLSMSASFLMTRLVLNAIQRTSSEATARYRLLFDESPSAVLEEDWSEAVGSLRSEFWGEPTLLRDHLLDSPDVVRRAVSMSKVVRANDAAMRLLEVSNPVRFLGYRDPGVVDSDNLESFVSALVCLYEGGRSWEREVPIRTRSGDLRWLLFRSVDTSRAGSGSSIVTGFADITYMKERNEAMEEVVRAKDEFIGNVSHELRTPLTAVIGLTSELAASPGMADEERNDLLLLVSQQADEMSNIVNDLLVAARAEVGTVSIEIQPIDLVAELRATLDGLGMDVEIPEEIPSVAADPRRVRQILRNLLTNAERYGGPNCRVTSGARGDAVWLDVRDDGEGIPEDEAEGKFEPYVTSGGRGTVGLGLTVARQLAQLMGGRLDYERDEGETVFRLQLPLVAERAPALASHWPTE